MEQTATYSYAQHISKLLDDGEKLDWQKAKKSAKDFSIGTDTEIMQACELAVVLSARKIASNGNSVKQQYEELKDLYERQVTIRPQDTKSKVLQQYSTPCPLAYLLGRFVSKNDKFCNGKILEPSAGNGLLTIAFPPQQVCVNELDEIRVANLKNLGFSSVTNQNASSNLELAIFPDKAFRGIMTNPPFAKLNENDKIERHGWNINTLDYKMAVLALDKMQDEGKSAVIVGGKMWNAYWKPLNERSNKQVLFGQWKTFLGYLYAQYNVVDVIYIDGDHIYQKQGTTYPIVAILIDGRHDYDESNKPRYVFDPYQDTIINTFDQLFDRIFPFLENGEENETPLVKSVPHTHKTMIFWWYKDGKLIKNDGWYDYDRELIKKKAEKCTKNISIKCYIREDGVDDSDYHTSHTITLHKPNKRQKSINNDKKLMAKALMLKMKMAKAKFNL